MPSQRLPDNMKFSIHFMENQLNISTENRHSNPFLVGSFFSLSILIYLLLQPDTEHSRANKMEWVRMSWKKNVQKFIQILHWLTLKLEI